MRDGITPVSSDPFACPRAANGRAPDVFKRGGWVTMRQFSDDEAVDFVIVGTGAGGGPLLAGLAEGGFSVVGFDAGPYFRPLEDFASDELEQEKLYWTDERVVDGTNPIKPAYETGCSYSLVQTQGTTPGKTRADLLEPAHRKMWSNGIRAGRARQGAGSCVRQRTDAAAGDAQLSKTVPDAHGPKPMNPLTSFLVFAFVVAALAVGYFVNMYVAIALFAVAVVIASSLKMANVWQKFVILRLGKLQSVRGAGLFAIIPVLDTVIAIIDERIQTTAFNAESALTKDTVPVNVDAIIFWHVHDAERAALAITNYREAIDRVAQTSLREMIGSSVLATLLSDRKQADAQLKDEIAQKTAPWGISVSSVEIRDVAIPVALQDAMSRQAQAEREKQARVILGSAEAAIAGTFVAAADTYTGHPMALQLRAMNIIYETTKERGATILMPSSMVDSLNPPSAAMLALALAGNDALKPNGALKRVEPPGVPGGAPAPQTPA